MKVLATTLFCAGLTFLSGCLFLSPDERPRVVELRMLAPRDVAKGPCGLASDLLLSDDLFAIGKVYRQAGDIREEIARFDLDVGPLEQTGRVLSAIVNVPATDGFETLLEIELYYAGPDGREPADDWSGEVVFSSGPVVDVQNFSLRVGQLPNQFVGTVDLAFAGEDPGPVTFSSIFFDAPDNSLSASYRIPNVQWEEDEPPKTIVGEMNLQFQPVVIFSLTEPLKLGSIAAGVDATFDTVVLAPRVPVQLGEFLAGSVVIRFEDGTPPREDGVADLARINPQPCD